MKKKQAAKAKRRLSRPNKKKFSAKTTKASPHRAKLVAAVTAEDAAMLESKALDISNQIRQRHMPHGTIMDPVFASPDSEDIVGYTRAGDSAIWTGHYLAAECFRYKATQDPAALDNIRMALSGLQGLVNITGSNVLARVAVPVDSPYGEGIQKEEGGHGVYQGTLQDQPHFWIGNTTRDQYSGVMFGLGVALDLVNEVRADAAALITKLVSYLLDHAWTVWMPNGQISTVFLQRPDQQLAFIQIAKQADSGKFGTASKLLRLKLSAVILAPIAYEVLDDHHSYFKFNLDTVNMYSLLHFEGSGTAYTPLYRKAYDVLRRTTDDHRNAHFNMIDRAIKGPDDKRDSETVDYLKAWLQRPRRDPFVDLRGTVKACGDDKACDIIPIEQRPTTDFLWQRSPFLLFGGGAGLVEGPGIDFILPYWMARFYGLL